MTVKSFASQNSADDDNELVCERTRFDRRTPASGRGRAAREKLGALGAVALGAAVGHGARGLFSQWRRVELFSARPRAQPRISLGRGWAARMVRPRVPAVFRGSTVEWQRPHFKRAPFWPEQSAGQSWRGCEGAVFLPRFQ